MVVDLSSIVPLCAWAPEAGRTIFERTPGLLGTLECRLRYLVAIHCQVHAADNFALETILKRVSNSGAERSPDAGPK